MQLISIIQIIVCKIQTERTAELMQWQYLKTILLIEYISR